MRRACTLIAAAALAACSSRDPSPPGPQPPAAPTLQAVAGTGSVTLTWTDPNVPAATRYDLYWSDGGPVDAGSAVLANVASPYVHGPLASGRTYRYRIAAVGAGGTSPLSAEVGATLAWTGQRATPVTLPGITTFGQSVSALPGDPEHFFGQSGYWDLQADLSIASGGFDGPFSGAQLLYLGRLATFPPTFDSLSTDVDALDLFPIDQSWGELTFLDPVFTAADGVAIAVVSSVGATQLPPISGSSGFLNATSDSRLQAPLDLTAATAATVGWRQSVWADPGLVAGAGASFRVTLRRADGTLVSTLAPSCSPPSSGVETCAADAAAGLGQHVRLSFELRAAAPGFAVVDDVTVTGAPAVPNGDFELGVTGWTTNVGAEPQNVTSGSRTLCADGWAASPCPTPLTVTRSFFTAPTSRWARLVDVFENPGAAPVTADVVYVTVAAAGQTAVIQDPGGWGTVLTGIDTSVFPAPVRDFGLVLGDAVPYHASGVVFAVRPVVVPAGGRVALASFLVMDGGYGARDGYGAAAGVGPAAAAIADGFAGADSTYRDWLTPAQAGAIVNF